MIEPSRKFKTQEKTKVPKALLRRASIPENKVIEPILPRSGPHSSLPSSSSTTSTNQQLQRPVTTIPTPPKAKRYTYQEPKSASPNAKKRKERQSISRRPTISFHGPKHQREEDEAQFDDRREHDELTGLVVKVSSNRSNEGLKPSLIAQENSLLIRAWLSSYKSEVDSRRNISEVLKLKLEKALACTSHITTPNSFRTAVCCEIFDTIFKIFQRFSGCLSIVREHLFASIYKNLDESIRHVRDKKELYIPVTDRKINVKAISAKVFLNSETYFFKVESLLKRKRDLQHEVSTWDDSQQTLREGIRKKQILIDKIRLHWQKSHLFATFRTWHEKARARRRQKNLLEHCFTKVSNNKLRNILRAWAKVAQDQSKQRAVDRINLIRRQKNKVEEEQKNLRTMLIAAQEEIDKYDEKLQSTEEELSKGIEESKSKKLLLEKQYSIEHSYKRLASSWMSLCLENIPRELVLMDKQICDLSIEDFVDPKLILPSSKFGVESLLETSVEDLLLLWVNYLVEEWDRSVKLMNKLEGKTETDDEVDDESEGESDSELINSTKFDDKNKNATIQNFGSDFKNCRTYISVISMVQKNSSEFRNYDADILDIDVDQIRQLSSNEDVSNEDEVYPPMLFDVTAAEQNMKRSAYEIRRKAEKIVNFFNVLGFSNKALTPESILNGVEDVNFIAIAYLFCNFPSLHPNVEPWKETRTAYDEALVAWNELKDQALETPDQIQAAVLLRVNGKLEEARRQLKWATSEHNLYTDVWNKLKKKVKLSAWFAMTERMRGRQIILKDQREINDMRAFTTVHPDCCSQASHIASIEGVLQEYWLNIRKAFQHYCEYEYEYTENAKNTKIQKDVNTIMNTEQFLTFLKDCKLIGYEEEKGKMSIDAVREKFSAEVGHSGIGKQAFIGTLISVADNMFDGNYLPGKVSKLLQEHLLPYACVSSLNNFRMELTSMEARQVFKLHREKLQEYFSNLIEKTNAFADMEANILVIFYDDMISRKIISRDETEENEIDQIPTLNQDEYDKICKTLMLDHGQVIYKDFQELLFAVSLRLDTDIFIPMYVRFSSFLDKLVDEK